MKQKTAYHFTGILALLVVLLSGCHQSAKHSIKKQEIREKVMENANMYDAAEYLLDSLKRNKADTILFDKRTCINCCDFFNIFWSANGKRFLQKIYFDFDDSKTHLKTIELEADSIFTMLGQHFADLKNNPLKGNAHKMKNGRTSITMIDHYCYTQLRIYTGTDSLITDRIKDHDFAPYTGYYSEADTSNRDKREPNDNYKANLQSKWNQLLTTIENELTSMPETISREKETMRTRGQGY